MKKYTKGLLLGAVAFVSLFTLESRGFDFSRATCHTAFHRMMSAQIRRWGTETRRCGERNHGLASLSNCQPYVYIFGGVLLKYPDPKYGVPRSPLEAVDVQMNQEFNRVWDHAENKFGRKCRDSNTDPYMQSVFAPLCGPNMTNQLDLGLTFNSPTTNSARLTNCISVKYVYPWLDGIYQVLYSPTGIGKDLTKECRSQLMLQAARSVRDFLRYGSSYSSSYSFDNRLNYWASSCSGSQFPAAQEAWVNIVFNSVYNIQPIVDFQVIPGMGQ